MVSLASATQTTNVDWRSAEELFPPENLKEQYFQCRQIYLCSGWRSRVWDAGSRTLSGWGTSWSGTARLWCPPCPARPSSASFPSVEMTVIRLTVIVNASLHLFAGIFEEDFIEERRAGLEGFINKIAGHPLAQNERCLHMFLQVAPFFLTSSVTLLLLLLSFPYHYQN